VKREDWDRRYAEAELVWSVGPNRFLVEEVESLQPGRALDLACGEGRNAVWLARRGWDVVAVDFSQVAVAKARRRAAHEGVSIELVCADLLQYEPAREAFDLVVILYLQIPAAERRIVLARAAAAVAPGGTFLLVGHDTTNLADGTGGPRDPEVLYTPDEIAGELPGLEVEKALRVLRDVDGAERPAIDALVRASRPAF
jgi:2-polyprenyl-3-methyl-5-hydroxy-6-metoxy-1,4-benzoquinol methylase